MGITTELEIWGKTCFCNHEKTWQDFTKKSVCYLLNEIGLYNLIVIFMMYKLKMLFYFLVTKSKLFKNFTASPDLKSDL